MKKEWKDMFKAQKKEFHTEDGKSIKDAKDQYRDKITLTHGAGGEILIMKALARAINASGPQYSDGLIVVADDVNSEYLAGFEGTVTAVDIDLDS